MARDLIHNPAIQFCTITFFFLCLNVNHPLLCFLREYCPVTSTHFWSPLRICLEHEWEACLIDVGHKTSLNLHEHLFFFSLTTLFKATLCKKWYFLWFCGPTVHVHMHLIVITLLMGWHGGAVVSSWNWFPFGGLPPSTSSSSLPWCVPYYYESPPLFLATSDTFHNAGSHLIHLSCKYID